jgi:hypothetical protein
MRADSLGAPLFFTISSPSKLVRIPLDHFAIPGRAGTDLVIETDLHFPKRVMPYDDRLLLYRILDCEVLRKEDPIYSETAKRALRADWRLNAGSEVRDILDRASWKELALGTGWFPIEIERGEPFRWMSDGAEIVLEGTTKRRIEITGALGPSVPSQRAQIKIWLNGQAVDSQSIDGRFVRSKIILDCGSALFQRNLRAGQNLFKMTIDGGGANLPEEARVLNFRVFHIGFLDAASPGELESIRK